MRSQPSVSCALAGDGRWRRCSHACTSGAWRRVPRRPASLARPVGERRPRRHPRPPELTPVRLQLQWAPQAQFAGYFAADEQGYYAAEGLDVDLLGGGPTSSRRRSARSPTARSSRSLGAQGPRGPRGRTPTSSTSPRSSSAPAPCRSSWKDSGITTPADFAGKKVGVWDFGNEFEVTAGRSRTAGLEPAPTTPRSSRPSTWRCCSSARSTSPRR